MSRISAKFETISPSQAEKWLEQNPRNRNLSKRRVDRLVKSLKSGQWLCNGEAIKIADNGTLIDGQHRLTACMVSKKPMESFVVRGLPANAIATIDLGAPRTLGNHLQMAGYKGGVFALASATILCMEFAGGTYVHAKDKTTPREALDFIENNKHILKSADIFTHVDKTEFRALLAQSLSIATYFLFSKINRTEAEKFFHGLVQGTNLGAKSPILKLRVELISLRKESKHAELTRRASLHFLCTAFQAWIDNSRIDSLPEYKHGITKITLPKAK